MSWFSDVFAPFFGGSGRETTPGTTTAAELNKNPNLALPCLVIHLISWAKSNRRQKKKVVIKVLADGIKELIIPRLSVGYGFDMIARTFVCTYAEAAAVELLEQLGYHGYYDGTEYSSERQRKWEIHYRSLVKEVNNYSIRNLLLAPLDVLTNDGKRVYVPKDLKETLVALFFLKVDDKKQFIRDFCQFVEKNVDKFGDDFLMNLVEEYNHHSADPKVFLALYGIN